MAGFRKLLPEIDARGACLYVIGPGAVGSVAGLRAATGYPGPVFLDPARRAYRAAALRRGLLGLLHPGTLLIGLAAFRAGFTQSAPRGDATQLGGAFIIAPGDRVLLFHLERFAGDAVRVERLLGALAPGPHAELPPTPAGGRSSG